MKRVPIRKKIRHLLIGIAMFSMLAISVSALVLMLRIRHRSEGYILENVEENVMDSLEYIAEFIEAKLDDYANIIEENASFIDGIYESPDRYVRYEYGNHKHLTDKEYCFKLYFANQYVKNSRMNDEIALLSNVEMYWRPILEFNDENITSLYLATETGFLLSEDKEHVDNSPSAVGENYFNYFERDWYVKAKEKETVVFTNISQDYFGRGLTLTCAAPFYKGGRFAGVVALDILVGNLQKNLISVTAGSGSYAFAVDKKGNIIASPDIDVNQTKFKNIYDEDSETKLIADDILSGDSGILLVNKSYYVFSPITNVDWVMCVKIPRSIITNSIKRIDRNIINMMAIFVIIAAIILVIVYKVSISFSNKLTEPIEKLKDDVEIISQGNFDYKADVSGNDEISDLAHSFNAMTSALKEYIDDITKLTAEKERTGAELNIATKIQLGMLPTEFPAFPDDKRFDIFATMNPAKEVGGDFYDFFKVDDKHIAIIVADVSGKGIPAALFMAIGKALLRDHTYIKQDLAAVFHSVNNILCGENRENLFITAFEGVIDLETGKLRYVNAGHELPFIYKKNKTWEAQNIKPGFVLGGIKGINFTVGEFDLGPGDRIFEYTDGVTEATNSNNELYGMDRLKKVLDDNKDRSVADLLPEVKKDIEIFEGSAPQFDDITMLCFEYRGEA